MCEQSHAESIEVKDELERLRRDLRGSECLGFKSDSTDRHVPCWSCAGMPTYQVSRIALNSMGSEKCSSSLSSDWVRAARKTEMTGDEKVNGIIQWHRTLWFLNRLLPQSLLTTRKMVRVLQERSKIQKLPRDW